MPASTTALTVLASPPTPAGVSFDEQASDVSPGNRFPNKPGTRLYVRNTQAGAINVLFESDKYGAERTVLTVSIPGSGTEHGVKVLGPFPAADFNDHSTTEAGSNGYVMCRQATGSDGDLVFCPFEDNPNLR